MDERFEFSPTKPILLVIAASAICVIFYKFINLYIQHNDWIHMITLLTLVLYLLGPLRVTVFMIMLRPAVVLTDKYISITDTGYTIYWADVKDVYLAHQGRRDSRGGIGSKYIIIRVREPDKYLKAIKNPITRWYRWVTRNWRETGAFEIDLSLIRGDEDELYHTVLKYYQMGRGF